jgi:hypothetical protein
MENLYMVGELFWKNAPYMYMNYVYFGRTILETCDILGYELIYNVN